MYKYKFIYLLFTAAALEWIQNKLLIENSLLGGLVDQGDQASGDLEAHLGDLVDKIAHGRFIWNQETTFFC